MHDICAKMDFVCKILVTDIKKCRQDVLPAVKQQYTNIPCENHKRMSLICADRELCSIGLQHSQTQLEDGFDSVEEKAVDHADGAVEGQDAEEEGEEPGEGDGGEGGEVWEVFSQLRQTLPDQLLKHRLIHLSSCVRK